VDRVHRVPRPRDLARQVLDTGHAAHLKDALRNAEAESCDSTLDTCM
jgi:hypothetical protein